MGVQLKKMIPGYAFAAPGVIFVAVYMGYPLLRSLYLRFTNSGFFRARRRRTAGEENGIGRFEKGGCIAAENQI